MPNRPGRRPVRPPARCRSGSRSHSRDGTLHADRFFDPPTEFRLAAGHDLDDDRPVVASAESRHAALERDHGLIATAFADDREPAARGRRHDAALREIRDVRRAEAHARDADPGEAAAADRETEIVPSADDAIDHAAEARPEPGEHAAERPGDAPRHFLEILHERDRLRYDLRGVVFPVIPETGKDRLNGG